MRGPRRAGNGAAREHSNNVPKPVTGLHLFTRANIPLHGRADCMKIEGEKLDRRFGMGCCQSQQKNRGVNDRRHAVRSTRPPPAHSLFSLGEFSLLSVLARRARTVLLLSSLAGAGDSKCRASVGDPQSYQRPLHACACGIGIAGSLNPLSDNVCMCVRLRVQAIDHFMPPGAAHQPRYTYRLEKVTPACVCCVVVCVCVRARVQDSLYIECVLSVRLCAKMPCVHGVHQRISHAAICICARADVHARTHTCTHAYGLQMKLHAN